MPSDLRVRVPIAVSPGAGVVGGRFNAAQLKAIRARDGGLFVHAAAGSGKTTVMVERFVESVRVDGVAVDEILAITFTEKAAAELKLRLRARFLELGERRHAREIERAWVETIHGFCSRVLRINAVRAGLDPAYTVLDEAQANRIERDAFEQALDDFVGDSTRGKRLRLLAAYTPQRLGEMVRDAYRALRGRGLTFPALPTVAAPQVADSDFRHALSEALRDLAPKAGTNQTVDRALWQLRLLAELLALQGAGEVPDPSELKRHAIPNTNARALRTPALTHFKDTFASYEAACRLWHDACDYELITELFACFCERYRKLKADNSYLDFSDLELCTRDLLSRDTELRERYRQRFSHIMVDEFQDTNRLQTELLDLIETGNVFTVGDEFQSIYGFRGADVSLFCDYRDRMERAGAVVGLAENYRSRRELLQALNLAFGSVFGAGFQRLDGGWTQRAEVGPSVEVIAVDDDSERWRTQLSSDEPFGRSMRNVSFPRAAEARLLSLRIDELTRAGYGYGEVCVLLRARSGMGIYKRALEDRKIPTYVASGLGYWSQLQVQDLRAYLASLCNPLDEKALYMLLASPMVGVSLDGLCLIGMRSNELARGVWDTLQQAFEAGDGSNDLVACLGAADRKALESFVTHFSRERGNAQRLSLETIIDRAICQTGYDRSVLALPAGERRMANLRKLMRLARTFEAEQGGDLRQFVSFVDEQGGVRSREGEAPTEAEGVDAVRLMTIHAAKGLEFPVVCVADLGRPTVADSSGLVVTADNRVGLRARSVTGKARDGLDLAAIKAERARDQEAEERRVYYVAMTRAMQQLILSGATDTYSWPESRPLEAPMRWVWRAFAPEMSGSIDQSGRATFTREHGSQTVTVACTVCSNATIDGLLSASDRAPEGRPRDRGAVARMRPPRMQPVSQPDNAPIDRLSYSALGRYRDCGYRFYLENVLRLSSVGGPPARREAVDLQQARGSVTHELLEDLDFERPARPSRARVAEHFAAQGHWASDSQIDAVCDQIEGFATCDLCKRLAACDRIDRELSFSFLLDGSAGSPSDQGLLLNGVVDVYARDASRTLIVDYKTDRLAGRDPAQLARDRYRTQLTVYALAALRAGASELEVCYSFLESAHNPVSYSFTSDDADRLERELRDVVGPVASGSFAPSDTPHEELCRHCVGRAALCSRDLAQTLAKSAE